jgi:hypothetical protein
MEDTEMLIVSALIESTCSNSRAGVNTKFARCSGRDLAARRIRRIRVRPDLIAFLI